MVDSRKFLLHLPQLLIDILSLLTAIARVQMLALHDIDTCLHRIFVECIDEKASDNFCLVIKFAQEPFFTVSGHSRYGRISPRILSAEIVTHVGPHGTQILDH